MIALKSGSNAELAFMLSKLTAVIAIFLLTANIAVNSADAQSDQKSLLMARAEFCGRAGRLEEANRIYTQVLSIDRNNCSALDHRSDNFLALAQYKQALDDLNHLIALCPSEVSFIRRTIALQKMGNFEAALSDLDNLLKIGEIPVGIEYLLVTRTVVRMLAGHYRDARDDAYVHLTMVPRSVLSLEICSMADAVCGRPADAISNLAQYSYIKLHKLSGVYSSQSKGPEQEWAQSKLLSASQAHSPKYTTQYKYWAECNFRQGAANNYQRAQLIARLEKEHSPLSPAQNHFARGIIYFYQGDYGHTTAEAARCASGSMLLYSDLLSCYCYIVKKEFPRAREILNRLTAIFPDSEHVLNAVDLYHYEADKRQDSIVEIQALLAKNPKNMAALYELAKIYSDLSELTDAMKYCDLALQLNPKSANLLLMKAHILTNQKKYAEGLKILAAIVAADHQNGAAYFARAAIYTQEARWSDAIDNLTKSIQLKYDLVKSCEARAACYSTLKKFDLARKDLAVVKLIDSGANMQRFPGE
jgi:tetratricopeptide (TPR) repeat protein